MRIIKVLTELSEVKEDKQFLNHFKMTNSRNSFQWVFCPKGVLKNFAKFTGKHPCQSLFFIKIAGLRWQLY